jgi:hypothetical protein
MYSVRVCSTYDRELPPPELGPSLTWDRLTEVLSREISPEAASLLAEPIRDDLSGQTHWHITSHDDAKPISALSKSERDALLDHLDERREEICRLAARIEATGGDQNIRLATALRAVLVVPDEELHVWSADGEPVLTAWGRHRDAPAAAGRLVKRLLMRGAQEEPNAGATIAGRSSKPIEDDGPGSPSPVVAAPIRPSSSGLDQANFAPAPATAAVDANRRGLWTASLLWALFVTLLALAYYKLLPACGLTLPLLSRFSDHCPDLAQSTVAAERIRNAALSGAIASAERRVAEIRGACAAQPPSRTDGSPSRRDAEQRVQRANVSNSGKLDITLVWNGREDLDLHVYCGDGHLFYGNRSACGGTFDIDRNAKRSDAVEDPVEHASWPDDPPAGTYRVEVVLFDRYESARQSIPFNVIIRDANGQREFKGDVLQAKAPVWVTEFQR